MLIYYFFRNYLPCFVNVMSAFYIINNLVRKYNNNILRKSLLFAFLVTFIYVINYYYLNYFIVFLVNTIILIAVNQIIYKEELKQISIIVICEQLIMFFSELIFTLIVFLIFNKNASYVIENLRGYLFPNIIISLIAILIIKIPFFKIFVEKIFCILNQVKEYIKYSLMFFLVVTLNIFLIVNYLNVNYKILIILSSFFIIIYCYILYYAINKNLENINIKVENTNLINNLNEYEKMLDYQRVSNHENKNQLLVIKTLIDKKDSKISEYINEILKEKREDNEIIYNKAKRIPSGGLQGLIYQKMLLMQEKNIEVNLDINSKVRKIDSSRISSKMNYDICRIVGIIIDNAIEETAKFNKKDREIIISMYVDDMFIIEVSNRIKDDIDLSKIYDKGYTSKQKGHGYGLSLLKKIVDENDNIINEVKIVNNIFTQVIKIKM